MTKLEKLEKYLATGNTATPKQIQKMFGLQNPTAAVHALRSKGVCIYGNKATLSTGVETTKYRVGQPTRGMISALHALGAFA
jgi:hypothetical protein